MPAWAKVALAIWVVGGVAFTILFAGEEQRTVESARVAISIVPGAEGAEVPKALQTSLDVEIAQRGERVRIVAEVGDVRGANPTGPDLEIIIDRGDDVYLNDLAGGPVGPGGGTWIRLSLDRAARLIPNFQGLLAYVDADSLLTSKSPPEEDAVGTEVVDGVETTMYEVTTTIDEEDDVTAIPPGALERLKAASGGKVSATVWIDDEGFTRRLVVTMPATVFGPRLGDEEVGLQLDVRDLGDDVRVDLPDDTDLYSS